MTDPQTSETTEKHPFSKYADKLVPYSFTLCPDDGIQFRNKGTHRFRYHNDFFWKKYGKDVKQCCKSLVLYPDLSTRSKMADKYFPRIHFHGTVIIKDSLYFWMKLIPKMRDDYVMEIDTISDPEEWHRYCTKMFNFYKGDPRLSFSVLNLKKMQPDARSKSKDVTSYRKQELADSDGANSSDEPKVLEL